MQPVKIINRTDEKIVIEPGEEAKFGGIDADYLADVEIVRTTSRRNRNIKVRGKPQDDTVPVGLLFRLVSKSRFRDGDFNNLVCQHIPSASGSKKPLCGQEGEFKRLHYTYTNGMGVEICENCMEKIDDS